MLQDQCGTSHDQLIDILFVCLQHTIKIGKEIITIKSLTRIFCYLDLVSVAGLWADGRDHLSGSMGDAESAVFPITDLDVIVRTVGQQLIIHDVIPSGWIAIQIKLYRFRIERETDVHQVILFNKQSWTVFNMASQGSSCISANYCEWVTVLV